MNSTKKFSLDGLFILNKPQGLSSNAALQRVKYLFHAKKAGHAGSLDPLATGVLPIFFGKATRLSHLLLEAHKVYEATVTMGIQTDTADSEGNTITKKEVSITEQDIQQVLQNFTGTISQIPPMYSALKFQGKPLYYWARQGKTIERKARTITVHKLILQKWSKPHAQLYVQCSKGTYIRTLAEDIGEQLGCGGHISALKRLQSGPYKIETSYTLEDLEKLTRNEEYDHLQQLLIPIEKIIEYQTKSVVLDS